MRIIYTFRKYGGFWKVNCPSNKSIPEFVYNSLFEAIDNLFSEHKQIEYFEIVIPQSMPIPIRFHKPIHRHSTIPAVVIKEPISIKYVEPEKPINRFKPKTLHEWGNKPIPNSTIQFKHGVKWIVVIPPYQKQDIFYLDIPLPGTKDNFTTGKGSCSKTLQIFNGTLKQDVFIDLGFIKAHIYTESQLRIKFMDVSKVYKKVSEGKDFLSKIFCWLKEVKQWI